MALVMRSATDIDDLTINGQILFANWELNENDTTDAFEINFMYIF